MRKEEKILISNNIKNYLKPYYESIGFSSDNKLCQFYNNNIVVSLLISGDYFKFVTIDPKFSIVFDEILENINTIIIDGYPLYNNGIFGLGKNLYFILNDVKNNLTFSEGFEDVITETYRINNDNDVQDACVNHLIYMKNLGECFISKFKSTESLYEFYVSLLNKRIEISKNINFSLGDNFIFYDNKLALTTLMAGIMIKADDFDEIVSKMFSHLDGNDYILNDARRLLEKYYV